MRRPLVLAVICGVALILVLVSQARLKKVVEEGRLQEPSSEGEGSPQDQKSALDKPMDAQQEPLQPNEAKISTKDRVISALLETRQVLRSQETVTKEAQENPHTTPPSVINAASKLADLAALERQYPEFQGDFQTFYLECARDESMITVTRAQCLSEYFQSRQADDEEKEKILSTLPPSVTRLYKEIDQG